MQKLFIAAGLVVSLAIGWVGAVLVATPSPGEPQICSPSTGTCTVNADFGSVFQFFPTVVDHDTTIALGVSAFIVQAAPNQTFIPNGVVFVVPADVAAGYKCDPVDNQLTQFKCTIPGHVSPGGAPTKHKYSVTLKGGRTADPWVVD
jgi:hypothetical protein